MDDAALIIRAFTMLLVYEPYRSIWFIALLFASFLIFTSWGNNIDSVKNLKSGAGKQIIIFGDSIASGYGVSETEAFPSVLSRQLGVPILNRGVSGDTTAAGLNHRPLCVDSLTLSDRSPNVSRRGTIADRPVVIR